MYRVEILLAGNGQARNSRNRSQLKVVATASMRMRAPPVISLDSATVSSRRSLGSASNFRPGRPPCHPQIAGFPTGRSPTLAPLPKNAMPIAGCKVRPFQRTTTLWKRCQRPYNLARIRRWMGDCGVSPLSCPRFASYRSFRSGLWNEVS